MNSRQEHTIRLRLFAMQAWLSDHSQAEHILLWRCPLCRAKPGLHCIGPDGRRYWNGDIDGVLVHFHGQRVDKMVRAEKQAPIAAWIASLDAGDKRVLGTAKASDLYKQLVRLGHVLGP